MDTEAFGADSGVGSTIALLEARLPGVRERRRQLEDELAAVVAQENAMVSVLQGLETLADTLPAGRSTAVEPAEVVEPAATQDEPAVTQDEPDAAPASAEPASGADVPVTEEPAPATIPTQNARRRTATTPAKKAAVKKAAAEKATPKKTTGRTTRSRKTAPASAPVADAPEQDVVAAPVPTKKTVVRGTAKKAAPKKAPAKKAAVEATAAKKAAVETTAAKKAAVETTAADAGPAPAVPAQTVSAPVEASGRRRRTDSTSVLAVLTGTSDSLRARQVADLLGLDSTDTDVNAVRTMLERLTKSGTVRRTGRGLYAAVSA